MLINGLETILSIYLGRFSQFGGVADNTEETSLVWKQFGLKIKEQLEREIVWLISLFRYPFHHNCLYLTSWLKDKKWSNKMG